MGRYQLRSSCKKEGQSSAERKLKMACETVRGSFSQATGVVTNRDVMERSFHELISKIPGGLDSLPGSGIEKDLPTAAIEGRQLFYAEAAAKPKAHFLFFIYFFPFLHLHLLYPAFDGTVAHFWWTTGDSPS